MCRAVIQFATQEPLGPRLFAAHHEGALPNHRLSKRLGRKDEKGYCSRSSLNEEALIIVRYHAPTPFLSSIFRPATHGALPCHQAIAAGVAILGGIGDVASGILNLLGLREY